MSAKKKSVPAEQTPRNPRLVGAAESGPAGEAAPKRRVVPAQGPSSNGTGHAGTGDARQPEAAGTKKAKKAKKGDKAAAGRAKPPNKAKAGKVRGAAVSAKKLSALEAAVRVLGETKQPMTCPELIEAMAAKGYWTSPGGKTPAATLYSSILRELQTKGKEARFKKTERGKFARA